MAPVVLGALMALPAYSQTADLLGVVKDKDGGALPGATVEVKNKGTGIERRVVTDKDGNYRVPALVPGDYKIKVTLSGFAETEREATINIGQEVKLDFKLELATYQAQVTVTGEVPLVKTEESDLSTVINEADIDNLPLNGRTFQNLAILVPGATSAQNFDPTKSRVGAISIGGQLGRGVNVSIDGGDNNDDAVGGILQQYSAESIQEFEVITQRFKAEYGKSGGGVLSIITKSGTNEFHGDVFGYYRGKSLNSKDYFEKQLDLPKSDFKRLQYGLTFGGPIIKDRTHFFLAYERQDEDTAHIVNTNGVWPQYEGSIKQPFNQDLVTAKFNHTLTDNQFLTFRYGYEYNERDNDQLEFCGPSCVAGAFQDNTLWSALMNHTWIATQSVLNEFTFQYSSFENHIVATDPSPAQVFPNLTRGANSNTPQTTLQKKYQFKDDFSLHAENHDWKAGVDWVHSPLLGGDFAFGSLGTFYYSVDDPNAPATYFFTFAGNAAFNRSNDQVGVYVQDDWSIGDKLILNLGLRYDVEFGTFDVPSTVLSEAVKNNPAGRKAAGLKRGELKNDVDNVAPRLGFAWDTMGNGKTVVRGGWGIFYDQIFLNTTLFDDFLANNPPYIGFGITSPSFGPGNIPDLSGYLVPGTGALVRMTSPDFETPYTIQSSVGVSQQLGDHMAFDADVVIADGHHEFRRRNINLKDPNTGLRTITQDYGSIRIMESTGESDYRALQLALRGRWQKFGFLASGSIADANVHQDDFFSRPQNNLYDNAPDHTTQDQGKPENFERWRLVLSGIYQLPADFQVSGIIQAAAARPWTTEYGYDFNGDKVRNDRPGERGNESGDPFFQTDLRVTKFFKFGKSMNLEASIDLFNVFDTVNFGGGNSDAFGSGQGNYDGRLFTSAGNPNPNYGQPTRTAGPPRQIQLGIRFNF
ncbi:MAG: TonB-dependent receptor [Acidobacteriota bacterium]